MHRYIYLTNSLNEEFRDSENRLFANLSGFGFSNSITSTRVGNSMLVSNVLANLPTKACDFTIWGDTAQCYQEYLKFVRFIKYEPIYLHYFTPNLQSDVFCQVKVIKADKGEQSNDSMLVIPLEFQPLTFWYDNEENIITTKRFENLGKSYPLKRPYFYSNISTSNIELFNNGVEYAPIVIEINGRVEDIRYTLSDLNGVVYGIGKINGEYDRVIINSFEIDESILLERDGATIPNPYNYQDLTVSNNMANVMTTFLKLKSGKSTLNFSVDESFKGDITIRWRNTYDSV